jgi:hypothetical protein
LLVPKQRAGLAVKRDQVAVAGDEEDTIAQQTDAAVRTLALDALLAIDPDGPPRTNIEGMHFVAVTHV